MQPAVSKITPSNQPKVGIENPGKSMTMQQVPYDAIFSNILRNRHLTCHQYSSITSSSQNSKFQALLDCETFANL